MSLKAEVIAWTCKPGENFYLLCCQRGELEIFEIIQRDKWVRAIDRVLIFRRAIDSMSRTLHHVISAETA